MKKFAAFLMVLSVGLFMAVGCGGPGAKGDKAGDKTTPPVEKQADAPAAPAPAAAAPAAPAEEKAADAPAAPAEKK